MRRIWAGMAIATIGLSLPVMAGYSIDPLERPFRVGTPAEIPIRTVKIAPDIFLLTGRGGNSVLRVTPTGGILVDTKLMYRAVYKELSATIMRLTGGKPVQYVFITHHHADHSGNGHYFQADGILLIGHSNLGPILATYKSSISPRNPATPDIMFDREYHVELDGIRAEARHWGPARTNADSTVYFPDRRILVAGELVNMDGHIAIDAKDGGGSLLGLRQRLDDVLALDFALVIPGQGGNAITRSEFLLYRDRVDALIERCIAAIGQGVPQDRLVDFVQAEELGFHLEGHFWRDPDLFPVSTNGTDLML